jgi:hypothetical protein
MHAPPRYRRPSCEMISTKLLPKIVPNAVVAAASAAVLLVSAYCGALTTPRADLRCASYQRGPCDPFKMSSERLIAPCGMQLLPAIAERPNDEKGNVTRKPSDADRFFTFLGTRTVTQLRARLRKLGQPQRADKCALSDGSGVR